MKEFSFTQELWLPPAPDRLFPFFANAENLDAITPPSLQFRIASPLPITMEAGTLIDYRIHVRGVPLRWRTRINVWEPPYRFVDEQIRGPYRKWLHEHTFESLNGGTLAKDRVDYAVPFSFFLHHFFVLPEVRKIFAFRSLKLQELFGAPRGNLPLALLKTGDKFRTLYLRSSAGQIAARFIVSTQV